jgi:hypothetical protein
MAKNEGLRSYPLPLRGDLLLVCGKCQRKLKKGDDPDGLSSLKKLLKKQGGLRPHVLKVPCLKMCPKGGVTVCTPDQVARHECSIIRDAEDVAGLFVQMKAANS